jgi:hypothetical protein
MPEVLQAQHVVFAIPDPELADLPAQLLAEPLQECAGGGLQRRGFDQHPRQRLGQGSQAVGLLTRDVVDSQDIVEGSSVGVSHQRHADERPPSVAVRMEVPLFRLKSCRLPGQQLPRLRHHGLDIEGMGDRSDGGARELLRGISEELAQGAVDLDKTPVEIRQSNADRRILERVSEALEQGARASLRLTAADDSAGGIYQGGLRMEPAWQRCHHSFR